MDSHISNNSKPSVESINFKSSQKNNQKNNNYHATQQFTRQLNRKNDSNPRLISPEH